LYRLLFDGSAGVNVGGPRHKKRLLVCTQAGGRAYHDAALGLYVITASVKSTLTVQDPIKHGLPERHVSVIGEIGIPMSVPSMLTGQHKDLFVSSTQPV
jgi:hypothetical protein